MYALYYKLEGKLGRELADYFADSWTRWSVSGAEGFYTGFIVSAGTPAADLRYYAADAESWTHSTKSAPPTYIECLELEARAGESILVMACGARSENRHPRRIEAHLNKCTIDSKYDPVKHKMLQLLNHE